MKEQQFEIGGASASMWLFADDFKPNAELRAEFLGMGDYETKEKEKVPTILLKVDGIEYQIFPSALVGAKMRVKPGDLLELKRIGETKRWKVLMAVSEMRV